LPLSNTINNIGGVEHEHTYLLDRCCCIVRLVCYLSDRELQDIKDKTDEIALRIYVTTFLEETDISFVKSRVSNSLDNRDSRADMLAKLFFGRIMLEKST